MSSPKDCRPSVHQPGAQNPFLKPHTYLPSPTRPNLAPLALRVLDIPWVGVRTPERLRLLPGPRISTTIRGFVRTGTPRTRRPRRSQYDPHPPGLPPQSAAQQNSRSSASGSGQTESDWADGA